MLNLYWKTPNQTRTLLPKPFLSEAEFESYIYKNQDLLPDIVIIHRRVRTGSKQGIPDMLGVDKDERICVIEMKNAEVSEEILPQVLGYAMWAETNPDSIKAIWLESKNQPEDVQIDWDSLEIRVIIIAPAFRPNVIRMASKIGYPIDLIQIQRFGFEESEFALVEVLENLPAIKVTTTKVMGNWDWDYYEKEHGKDATTRFQETVEALAQFVHKKGWELPYNLNKYYTGFKLGNKVVFSVNWHGTHAWKVHMKLSEEQAKNFKTPTWEFQRYDSQFNEALFRPKLLGKIMVDDLESMLVAAYRQVSGIKQEVAV